MSSFYSRDELASLGLASYGEDVLISRKASIYKPEKISLGNKVRIEDFCMMIGPLIIGSFVHIAAGTMLRTSDEYPIIFDDVTGAAPGVHIMTNTDDYSGPFLFGPHFPEQLRNLKKGIVHVKRFVVIGTQSVILPKVTLEEGSSVGAMSLVSRSTKPWTVYFGIPARPIGSRDIGLKEKYEEYVKVQEKNCSKDKSQDQS